MSLPQRLPVSVPAFERQADAGLPTAACQPLRLPALDALQVELGNRVYGLPPCHAGPGRLLVWQAVPPFTPTGELQCRWAGGMLRVAVDHLGALEPRLRGVELVAPSEACSALAEHALAPVLDLLERLTGHSLLFEAFRRPSGPVAGDVVLGFVLPDRQGQPEVRGHVGAPAAFWRGVAPARAPVAPARRQAALPLRLSLRVGGCRVGWSELRRLAPGDALRASMRATRAAADAGLPVLALQAGGRLGFRARAVGHDLILDTSMSLYMESNTPLRTAPGAQPGTPAELDALVDAVETELSFEIGSLQMTLAELSRLRPGQALRLGVRLRDQPVRIVTAGRTIARGELATLGDELVVVVTDTGTLPLV